MSTWIARLKDFLVQLAAERAEMLSVGEDEGDRRPDGNGQQPIPFWLWHMF